MQQIKNKKGEIDYFTLIISMCIVGGPILMGMSIYEDLTTAEDFCNYKGYYNYKTNDVILYDSFTCVNISIEGEYSYSNKYNFNKAKEYLEVNNVTTD